MENTNRQEEITRAIALDFKKRNITHSEAAKRLGTTKAIVSNQISGHQSFSKNAAKKFADCFGYNELFLLFGEGELLTEPNIPQNYTEADIVAIQRKVIASLEETIRIQNILIENQKETIGMLTKRL